MFMESSFLGTGGKSDSQALRLPLWDLWCDDAGSFWAWTFICSQFLGRLGWLSAPSTPTSTPPPRPQSRTSSWLNCSGIRERARGVKESLWPGSPDPKA